MGTKIISVDDQMVALESEIYLLEWDMVNITNESILAKKQEQLDELTAQFEHLQKLEKTQKVEGDEDEEQDWDDENGGDKDKDDDWDKDDQDWE
jgi:hypothetical protein